jgi:L-aspartate oxidase
VHAGGAATGAEIERALVAAVRRTAAVLHEHTFALDLMIEDGCCVGVQAIDPNGHVQQVRARNVLLATGGAGQLFAITTNPSVATGDGVAMALRAEVAIADLEFFQFHPTALYHPGIPRPLLSEALRGHGALLRDCAGERFVDEMLPRDVVSRAILAEMLEQHSDHVWLDATGLDHFAERFPTIYSDLVASGLDPMTDWLPVAPAAHHQCGGIVTDLFGATSMPGLWAAGETACSGVHGANRLASNSLLEGMVFGPRAIESIASGAFGPSATGAMRSVLGFAESDDPTLSILGVALPLPESGPADVTGAHVTSSSVASSSVTPQSLKRGLQQAMSADAGVQRSAETLERVTLVIAQVMAELAPMDQQEVAVAEVQNLAQIAQTLVAAALARTESRGTHARLDYPSLDPAQAHRLVVGG